MGLSIKPVIMPTGDDETSLLVEYAKLLDRSDVPGTRRESPIPRRFGSSQEVEVLSYFKLIQQPKPPPCLNDNRSPERTVEERNSDRYLMALHGLSSKDARSDEAHDGCSENRLKDLLENYISTRGEEGRQTLPRQRRGVFLGRGGILWNFFGMGSRQNLRRRIYTSFLVLFILLGSSALWLGRGTNQQKAREVPDVIVNFTTPTCAFLPSYKTTEKGESLDYEAVWYAGNQHNEDCKVCEELGEKGRVAGTDSLNSTREDDLYPVPGVLSSESPGTDLGLGGTLYDISTPIRNQAADMQVASEVVGKESSESFPEEKWSQSSAKGAPAPKSSSPGNRRDLHNGKGSRGVNAPPPSSGGQAPGRMKGPTLKRESLHPRQYDATTDNTEAWWAEEFHNLMRKLKGWRQRKKEERKMKRGQDVSMESILYDGVFLKEDKSLVELAGFLVTRYIKFPDLKGHGWCWPKGKDQEEECSPNHLMTFLSRANDQMKQNMPKGLMEVEAEPMKTQGLFQQDLLKPYSKRWRWASKRMDRGVKSKAGVILQRASSKANF